MARSNVVITDPAAPTHVVKQPFFYGSTQFAPGMAFPSRGGLPVATEEIQRLVAIGAIEPSATAEADERAGAPAAAIGPDGASPLLPADAQPLIDQAAGAAADLAAGKGSTDEVLAATSELVAATEPTTGDATDKSHARAKHGTTKK